MRFSIVRQRRRWSILVWIVLSATLFIGCMSALVSGARAVQILPEQQSARSQETPTPLLPNTPVASRVLLVPATISVPEARGNAEWQPEPFPITNGVTETIRLVLEDYAARAAATSQEDLLALAQQLSIPWLVQSDYMPFVARPLQAQPSPIATLTPEPEPPPPADAAVVLWAEPSLRVGRGATLTYEIRVHNYGRGAVRSTRVTLPFDPGHLAPVGSALNQGAGDWISELTGTSLTVTFGEVGGHESRSGKIYFQVAGGLATDTVIRVRGTYCWSDAIRSRDGFTNWPPVLVGGGNDTAAYVWTVVEPAVGRANLKRTFFSDRFLPGEGITTWLNTASEVRALELRGSADSLGRVWLENTPSDLPAGMYQMVMYGNRSQLTGVVSFEVR